MNQFAPSSAAVLGVLAERGWLAEQPDALRDWIARNGRWKTYDRGQTIYSFGDPADALYGLGEGAVEVTLPLVGEEEVTVYRAELGFWIGEAAVLARLPRIISLHAATPCRLFRVPGVALRSLLDRQPELWPGFCALSLQNSGTAVQLLAEALSLSSRARLSRVLLRLSARDVRVEASQHDLARLIGMNRSSLRRALGSLEECGAIEQKYGSIIVRDRQALEVFCNEP
ncbi:Crp/Fnr family transcriptional regulator [Tabrizicola sp. J26]|uniref:Crp/Fnr family transcriptional regulator n=1 Tax=Alitabrizicola rongguiensis TaxID=2909234 RepID=UPI001F4354D5|nr:Crp/Fnr family transcriptional regulator [Tabrizicola rongguiensis]MCF1707454.1 Crp/Fnr family transcriptional regulator [Tabrizicola rongguiensis]